MTLNFREEVIRDGLVVVDGDRGKIEAVDEYENRGKYFCDELYGGSGFIILPGLINTHTHIPMIILQGVGAGLTGFDWLRTIWFLESILRPRQVYVASKLAIALLLENGVTTFADHYFYEEEVARAVEETGVRAVLAKTVIELSDYAPKHSLQDSVNFALRYKTTTDKRISGMIGVHSLYSCTLETLRRSVELSESTGLRIHMHFAESLHEVEYISRSYSTSPARLAQEIGLLKVNPLLAHATYLSDEDIEVVSRYKPCIAYSPFTIMSWGQGIARVSELMDRKVNVSLATDGPVTDGDLSMFKQMKLAVSAQSSRYLTPNALTPKELLEMATIRAAKCLGLEGVVGSIEPGKYADILVLKPSKARLVGLHDNPYSTLVMNVNSGSVYMTIVHGRILYNNGVLKSIDIEETFKKVVEERSRLLEEAGLRRL